METQAFNFFGERIPDLEISDDEALWEHYRLSNRKRRERLHQFLRIYAPQFADQFNRAAGERFSLLHSLVFGPHPTAADGSAALEESSTELNLALQKLREYIRDNIKPTAS